MTEEGIIAAPVVENITYANSTWKEMNALKILHELYPEFSMVHEGR
jgi:hypothetical protein